MCRVCDDFDRRAAAGKVTAPDGAIAQLVERFHGMEEAGGSIPPSSTNPQFATLAEAHARAGRFFGGLVAGEGSFSVVRLPASRVDGSERLRFVFSITMAQRDRALLESLRAFLGTGSLRDAPARRAHWQPTTQLVVNGRRSHRLATIPFALAFLPPTSEKRRQFDRWHSRLTDHDRAHPTRWGQGPSTCSVPDCHDPVRGRGLCRKHYYRATGY